MSDELQVDKTNRSVWANVDGERIREGLREDAERGLKAPSEQGVQALESTIIQALNSHFYGLRHGVRGFSGVP